MRASAVTGTHVVSSALAAVVVALTAPGAPAASAQARISGGTSIQSLSVCGRERPVTTVAPGGRATLVVSRPGAHRLQIVDEICANGDWTVNGRSVVRLRRGRGRVALDTSTVADHRIIARAGRARSAATYLRVGVGEIVDVPVSFTVLNTNRSKVACLSDGREYTIRGHLVAPRSVLVGPRSRPVTLYVHGIAFGELIWRFQGLPGYDYPYEQAKAGHASVTIDRLGFGASGTPDGSQLCIGSQADMLHQIIGMLRSGRYGAGGYASTSFQRVALAGHSYGGFIAPVEAYSFHDVDALLGLASAFDQGFGPEASAVYPDIVDAVTVCGRGGEPKRANSPSGYVLFSNRLLPGLFVNADPAVTAAVLRLHERDPCGELGESFAATLVANRFYLRTVTVPVLLVFGDRDIGMPPSFAQPQADLYSGSPDVTTTVIGNAGHVLMLQRTAPAFRAQVSNWLGRNGF